MRFGVDAWSAAANAEGGAGIAAGATAILAAGGVAAFERLRGKTHDFEAIQGGAAMPLFNVEAREIRNWTNGVCEVLCGAMGQSQDGNRR